MRSCTFSLLLLSLVSACPADPATGADAGRDAGARDAPTELDAPAESDDTGSAPDAGSAPDVDSAVDAGRAPDAGREDDAGERADAWRDSCPTGLGAFCEDAPCPTGFECMVGRCTPQARMLCGGFAGTMCSDPGYPACTFFSSADFGPCLTLEEQRCICDDPARAAGFACP